MLELNVIIGIFFDCVFFRSGIVVLLLRVVKLIVVGCFVSVVFSMLICLLIWVLVFGFLKVI